MAIPEKDTEIVVQKIFIPKFFYEIEDTSVPDGFNAKRLKTLVSYISHLYSKGEISEKAFKSIIGHAYLIYIERKLNLKIKKVELRIQGMLEQYLLE